MGLREKLEQHRGLATALALIAVLIAGFMAVRTLVGPPKPKMATLAFYTTDDGKTWFKDDFKKAPPFKTADGKDAVGAMVVSCMNGKEPFVLYMWRYTDEGKAEVQSAGASSEFKKEVKKPNGTTWVKTADFAKAAAIQAVECPPGQEDFVTVDP